MEKNNSVWLMKYYNELPTWAKGVVGLIVVGGTGLIVYSIIKKIKADAEYQKAKASLLNFREELNSLITTGVSATFEKSVYDGYARQIVDEFNGCDFSNPPFGVVLEYYDMSTSGKKLYDILNQFNNNRDFLELVDSFDIRTIDACGWGTGDLENVNLYEAVNNELQSGEVKYINKMLRTHGITYQL